MVRLPVPSVWPRPFCGVYSSHSPKTYMLGSLFTVHCKLPVGVTVSVNGGLYLCVCPAIDSFTSRTTPSPKDKHFKVIVGWLTYIPFTYFSQ